MALPGLGKCFLIVWHTTLTEDSQESHSLSVLAGICAFSQSRHSSNRVKGEKGVNPNQTYCLFIKGRWVRPPRLSALWLLHTYSIFNRGTSARYCPPKLPKENLAWSFIFLIGPLCGKQPRIEYAQFDKHLTHISLQLWRNGRNAQPEMTVSVRYHLFRWFERLTAIYHSNVKSVGLLRIRDLWSSLGRSRLRSVLFLCGGIHSRFFHSFIDVISNIGLGHQNWSS